MIINSSRRTIDAGYQNDNNATTVAFDISKYIEEYGSGTWGVRIRRQNDPDGYPSTHFQVVDGVLYYTFTSGDCAQTGMGEIQLSLSAANNVVKFSKVYYFYVNESLGNTATPPDPWQDYITTIQGYAQRAEAACGYYPRIATDTKNWEVYSVVSGVWVDTGVCAKGQKGDPGESWVQLNSNTNVGGIVMDKNGKIAKAIAGTDYLEPSALTAHNASANAHSAALAPYSLITNTGTKIELVCDTVQYKLYANLYNANNTEISRSAIIDLPIEGLVSNVYYDNSTKELIVTYKSGTQARVAMGALVSSVESDVAAIKNKIPAQASVDNKLADKAFVNSSIATNTANYISNNGEPFTSVAQLEAYSGTVTNNDYAFVSGVDEGGNSYYDRYKATVSGTTVTWAKEYRLNNSSFTAAQWAAITSGITSVLVAKIHEHDNKTVLDGITSLLISAWNDAVSWISTNGANLIAHLSNTVNHITNSERLAWNAKVDSEDLPTKTSDLTNDGDGTNPFLTAHQSLANYYTKTETDSALAAKSTVSVSASGTSTDEVEYITINGTEKKIKSGDEAAWGNITGTLSNQIDLQGEIARLDGRCDNLQSIGRYLSLWNCVNGRPATNPTTMPYTYKAGDYYRVNSVIGGPYLHQITYTESSDYYFTVTAYSSSSTPMTQWGSARQALCDNGYDNRQHTASGSWGTSGWADGVKYITVHSTNTSIYVTKMAGGLSFEQIYDYAAVTDTVAAVYNYKPNGSSYNNAASTTVETGPVAVGDVYFYDGTSWTLQINHASESGGTWGSIAGTLSNQTDLQTALDAKAPQSTTYTKTEVDTALAAKIESTDYATNSTGGVIKIRPYYGTGIEEGFLCGVTRNDYSIADNKLIISKGTLENVLAAEQFVKQSTLHEYTAAEIDTLWEATT